MKRLIFVFFTLFCSVLQSSAQTTPAGDDKVEIKAGTQLVYDVNTGEKQYQFIVTVKKLGSNVTFDWEMTEPINRKGTVTMTAAALESATGLYNFFSEAMVELTDKTSVWISKTIWKDIHDEDEMAEIVLDEEGDTFMRFDAEGYKTTYKGNTLTLTVSDLKSLLTDNVITVWENEKFPLILSMNLGWTIKLKEIK